MTYQQPSDHTPYVPGSSPPPGDWTPPAAARKSHMLPILLGVLALSIVGVVGLIIAAALNSGTSGTPTAPGVQRAAEPTAVDPVPINEAAPAPTSYTPKIKDFALTPKILDKECFGSAGCNVEVKVEVTYAGPTLLSEDDTWLITYEVTGDEDGPVIGSLELTGDVYEVNDEFLSTKSSKTKVSIKVTDVEKVGL